MVPQEEQVEQVPQVAPRLFTQLPLYMLQLQEDEEELPDEPFSCGQADCGKSGREKNSSQTFSANSSQGGMAQKP